MIDDIIAGIDALSAAPAEQVLARLADAVAADAPLTTDDLIALAFIAGVEAGTVGLAGRLEVALTLDALRQSPRATLIDTGRAYADRTISDLIAEAQADRDG